MLQVDESGEPLSDPSGSEPEGEVGDESIGVAQGELKSPTLLEASGNTVLAVTANGNVVRWGRTGATTSRANPEPTGMSGVTSVSVAVDGSWRLVGSTASGSVLFGGVTQGYTLAPDNVVKVATSPVDSSHTCQLLQTGRVECLAWPGGDGNKYGQVGDGTTIAAGFWREVVGLTDAVDISVGGYHTCAKRAGGQLMCWGYAIAIGDGTQVAKSVPTVVPGMNDVRSFSAGLYHTCATQGSSGQVYCWGVNLTGAIGDGTNYLRESPQSIGITARSVTAGAGHSCAITGTSGWSVKCWGSSGYGQMGLTTTAKKTPFSVPAPSPSLTPTVIEAGGNFTCAAKSGSTGDVVCWGQNDYGQLGNGTTANTTVRPSYVLGNELKLNGEACTAKEQCQSRTCTGSVCVAAQY